MTPLKQRVALAEFAGWKVELYHPDSKYAPYSLLNPAGEVVIDGASVEDCWEQHHRYPDYLNDLNALHEVWLKLDRKQRISFIQDLRFTVVDAGGHAASSNEDIIACCENATAPQRAEALLRTIGKWSDDL